MNEAASSHLCCVQPHGYGCCTLTLLAYFKKKEKLSDVRGNPSYIIVYVKGLVHGKNTLSTPRCTLHLEFVHILGRAQYYRYLTVDWQLAQRKTSTGPFGKLGLGRNPYLLVCPFFVECPLIYTWHPVARR